MPCANGHNVVGQQLPTLLVVVTFILHVANSLTGFKLCAITTNNLQQHATGCANRHIRAIYT